MHTHVKKLMEAKGITIRSLMMETGLSNQTILNARKCEKDDEKKTGNICNCTLGTLDRIARALGVSVHDLFDDTPEQTGQPENKNILP